MSVATHLFAGDLDVLLPDPADFSVHQVCHDVLRDLQFPVTVHRPHQLETGHSETAAVQVDRGVVD